MIHPSTFSIVACDLETHAWGVAVASKFPAVGSAVPWAQAEAGAIATQSYSNTSYGPRGLALMAEGVSAQETLSRLLADDPGRELRQVGLVDARGQAATFTGKRCYAWAGGLTGAGYAIQGNILVGAQVIEAMEKEFLASQGDLPQRLFAALRAGDAAGGDRRGRQSAAIYVAKEGAGYGGFNDRWIDYRVDDHPDPVTELGRLLNLHRLYFGHSAPSERLRLEGEVLLTLQKILISQGYRVPMSGDLDIDTRQALTALIGNENFEERCNPHEGWIDPPILHYLMKKFLGESPA